MERFDPRSTTDGEGDTQNEENGKRVSYYSNSAILSMFSALQKAIFTTTVGPFVCLTIPFCWKLKIDLSEVKKKNETKMNRLKYFLLNKVCWQNFPLGS